MAYTPSSALSVLIYSSPLQHSTSIDMLRVIIQGPDKANSVYLENQGDDIISNLVHDGHNPMLRSAEDVLASSSIEILFLTSVRVNGSTTKKLRVSPPTLEELCLHFAIPVAFLDAVLKPNIWSKQSGGSFHRRNDEGQVGAIEGFYHYFNEWDLGPLHTWFSYNLKSKSSSYLIIDCPSNVKARIIANANDPRLLSQPFAIDLLIVEECALWRETFINDHYNQIFDWHEKNGSMDPPLKRHVNTVDNLQRLHQLSRTWNMIFQDLGDLEERLDFLMDTAKKLNDAGLETRSATESFKFFRDRNHLRQRWVSSFGDRTRLIINFVFSIASHNSIQTNLAIAGSTKTIAEETKKDNSSMITIATMTMLFLPSTFVSAIFSMAFFNSGVDNDGKESFKVSSRLWIFFAVAVPLTVLVSGVYQYWRREKERRMELRHTQNDDIETGSL